MTLSKYCINCDVLLEQGQSDFCTPECEQEFKNACDQELLANLTLSAQETGTSSQVENKTQSIPDVKEFAALLENDSNLKKD